MALSKWTSTFAARLCGITCLPCLPALVFGTTTCLHARRWLSSPTTSPCRVSLLISSKATWRATESRSGWTALESPLQQVPSSGANLVHQRPSPAVFCTIPRALPPLYLCNILCRNQRPARVLSTHPPGPKDHPVRLHRSRHIAPPHRQPPRHTPVQLSSTNRGAHERQDVGGVQVRLSSVVTRLSSVVTVRTCQSC